MPDPTPNNLQQPGASPYTPFYGNSSAGPMTTSYQPSSQNGDPYTVPYPGFTQGFGPNQFTQPGVAGRMNPIGSELRSNVTDINDSPYARLRMSRAAQTANGQAQGEIGALASKGGIRSGAYESALDRASKNTLAMDEGIGGDEARFKQEGLSKLSDIDMAKANSVNSAGQFDTKMMADQANQYNASNQNLYQSMTGLLGAQQQAGAISRSGKK